MRTDTAHGTAMNDPTLCCPTCGTLLQQEGQEVEDTSAGSVRLWQCALGHWWMHSPGFGWLAIDPGDSPADPAISTVEE
jgi:hypothetical protein